MTTGDIATWIIALIIFIAFVFGMKRIYHNFSSGKCDSCGTNNGCSGGCHCDCCGIDNKLISKVKDKQH